MISEAAARRVLIVGCGRIAGGFNETDESKVLTHVLAYRRLGADVVACCDRNGAKAEAFARRWAVPAHGTDLGELLERTRPAVVSVCTPPRGRVQIVEQIAAAPSLRAAILEKPIAETLDEAYAVRAAVRDAKLPVIVNYFRAFDPFYQELTRRCREAAFGPLREVVVRYYGSAMDNASHVLERVVDLMGTDVTARRLSGSRDAPMFVVSAPGRRLRALFIPTTRCRYAPLELDLLFDDARIRVIDSEGRAEGFAAAPDPDFAGFVTLTPAPLLGAGGPNREGLLGSVGAALKLADGVRADPDLLERAVVVAQLLDRVTA